jgi:hypothetical protein
MHTCSLMQRAAMQHHYLGARMQAASHAHCITRGSSYRPHLLPNIPLPAAGGFAPAAAPAGALAAAAAGPPGGLVGVP